MAFQELFDETLDINSTGNYRLAVQVSSSGVAFCILDAVRNKYVMLRAYEAGGDGCYSAPEIDEIMRRDDFLGCRYMKVTVIAPAEKSTLVPVQLYDPARRDEYFRLNHPPGGDAAVAANRLNDPEAYVVFEVARPVYDIITGRYPAAVPVHHLKPLLSHVYHAGRNFRGDYVHLHVESGFFNLAILRSNSLVFCNTFGYRNTDDILYYVMNVMKSFETGHETAIHLSGPADGCDGLASALRVYVRQVSFSRPSGGFTFSYVFDDCALHRYINLFNVPNCV
ncbi:MAG: DUF3822 family protein [Bacteroidales bacterium]|jgi:hypothetical protein|nr:DUF3822 family protein [Bacteroidales bacterium]